MGDAEPDIDELFAPLRPAQASDVVLSEAREVLSHVKEPIDAATLCHISGVHNFEISLYFMTDLKYGLAC